MKWFTPLSITWRQKNSADDISYDAMIKAGAILKKVIEQLPEPSRSVILGYELEKRWDSIKEMEPELELKNGEMKKNLKNSSNF